MRRSPVEAVIGAVVGKLKASTGVTGLVSSTGVYNHVEQGASFPYVVVTSPTHRRNDTMGRFGADTMVNVLAVSQARGDKEGAQILDHCTRALDLQSLSTTQHATLGIAWESSDRYSETINGVQTRYHVGMFRVWTEQSST